MKSKPARFGDDNPFATRWVRPGALPFFFPDGQHPSDLISQLARQSWRGQIIGPHGGGKSTLLATLLSALPPSGIRPLCIALRDSQAVLPADFASECRDQSGRLIVVDGYEQLAYWSRRRLKCLCRKRTHGLLVTAHRRVGLPTLWSAKPSLAMTKTLVSQLLTDSEGRIHEDDVTRCYTANAGNVRDTLFDLYDLYERRRMRKVFLTAREPLSCPD